ncbi:MAG: RluA family pseudouridine synthase [Patescibacteria group bacterium]|nr:RluA family pseudouridine synthase [Patescibacteria group bacterium]
MKIQIIYQDKDLVIIDKPAGVVVNKAVTVKEETIQSWFENRLKENAKRIRSEWEELVPADFNDKYGTPKEIFSQRNGLVHRLDKDTSGVLLLATNPGSLVNLLSQFKQRQIHKKYQCLVHGSPKVDSAQVNVPIGRSKVNRRQFWVDIGGKKATTLYRVINTFKKFDWELLQQKIGEKSFNKIKPNFSSYHQGFSLIECFPKTGRTHQIRVHMRHIGHPLVADKLYSGRTRPKLDNLWCPRQFLHASWIEFFHPGLKKKVNIETPLSADLANALKLLIK